MARKEELMKSYSPKIGDKVIMVYYRLVGTVRHSPVYVGEFEIVTKHEGSYYRYPDEICIEWLPYSPLTALLFKVKDEK